MKAPTYFTVQMSDNARGGRHCIHLGRDTETGGLGDNICKNSRHGWDHNGQRYGFSANGGGSTDRRAFPCGGCVTVLNHNRGSVRGVFAHLFMPIPKHRRAVAVDVRPSVYRPRHRAEAS